MDDLFLFVRPPRPLWPFNGPGTSFWPPLAFASMAAALRQEIPDLPVRILDAPARRMGWASLERELRALRPAYVAFGEEAVSCVEGLRLAVLAHQLGATVLAGGCFFGHVAPQALATGLIDIVAHGEGERTLVELVRARRSRSGLRHVRGISFLEGEEVVFTGPRQPIENLDDLPMPAYDLLPVEAYGGRSHPALAALELGRGCAHACDFCVLWRQMGRFAAGRLAPLLRTKSAARVADEVLWLARRYGRRYIGWIDPCFNADPDLPRAMAERLLRAGCRVGQSAWVRLDALARDLRSGALDPCVRSGLNEIYVGVERFSPADLAALRKGTRHDELDLTLRQLRRRYPQVFVVASVIYGLDADTPAAMWRLTRDAHRLPADQVFFIPRTPLPGTAWWTDDLWDASGERFRDFDFLPHPDGDARLARLTRSLYWSQYFVWNRARLENILRGAFALDRRRRRLTRRLLARTVPFVALNLARQLLGRPPRAMRMPDWYDS